MSVKITIGSTVINFPTSGTDANWAEAMDEFAVAVEQKLLSVGLIYDVAPQVSNIPESGTLVLNTFPGAQVRSFSFQYATYRISTGIGATTKRNMGIVNCVYNETSGTWTIQHEFLGDKQANGEPYVTFDMNGDTLEAYPVSIGGTYDSVNSTISFTAKTLPVSN